MRVALLTGSPWLVIPVGEGRRRAAVEFLRSLHPPAEALFPDDVVNSLLPNLREVAMQMRDSMAFEASWMSWFQHGILIDRFVIPKGEEATRDSREALSGSGVVDEDHQLLADYSSPRLLRHGSSNWIIPGLLWDEGTPSQALDDVVDMKPAVQLLLERLVVAGTRDKESGRLPQQVDEHDWLRKSCADFVVVSSMHNERYAFTILTKELRRSWKLHSLAPSTVAGKLAPSFPTKCGQEDSILLNLSCSRAHVVSAEDGFPEIVSPSPWLVGSPLWMDPNTNASTPLVFIGTYAHIIYANYKRWYVCLRASLMSYSNMNYIGEMYNFLKSILMNIVDVPELI
ncbi:hypothetical protein ERJ75_001527600 [Trypanosoma vivax]|nr:hypothetical protein ERJ75_001527600 [Trypanosoma vivax]